jgi:hypothetical protein
MKNILIITLLAILTLIKPSFALGQVNNTPIAVLATARGDVQSGIEKIGKNGLQLPKGGQLVPASSTEPLKTEVSIVRFSSANNEQRGNRDEVLKLLDSAGYRPARLEEMLSVRGKFQGIDGSVVVYGSQLKYEGKTYGFQFQYRYQLGTDILAYKDGARPGMFEDTFEWLIQDLAIAAVKK